MIKLLIVKLIILGKIKIKKIIIFNNKNLLRKIIEFFDSINL
jgi:hypothetical protein